MDRNVRLNKFDKWSILLLCCPSLFQALGSWGQAKNRERAREKTRVNIWGLCHENDFECQNLKDMMFALTL